MVIVWLTQPKEITDFKKFLELAKGNKTAKDTKDTKTKPAKKSNTFFYSAVFIKKNKKLTKFKIRRGKYLYTFKTNKDDLAKRLEDGLDGNQFEKVQIKNRVLKKKEKKWSAFYLNCLIFKNSIIISP